MSTENLSVVLKGVKDLQMENRPVPQPKAGGISNFLSSIFLRSFYFYFFYSTEVQIAMGMVGICCSDVHYFQHGRIGDFVVNNPMVMGHEGGGTVSAVGEGVTHLKVGDRVTIEPGSMFPNEL